MTEQQPISRRKLIRNTALAGTALAAASVTTSTAQAAPKVKLKRNSVILFQGDSITDAGRDKKREGANVPRAFGDGYPFVIASQLQARFPKKNLKCFNRGISGNKVPDLDKRWDKDCIDMQPALLSILVGVNDIWHKLNGNYDGTVQQYEDGFNALLAKTREALPDTALVICEPFALRCGAVKDNWFPEMDERRAACKRVAEKAEAIFVPFQEAFDKATTKQNPAEYWAKDGVHPTMAGHGLMARLWVKHVFPWGKAKA